MKNLTTTLIALFTIATSVFANNTNPSTSNTTVLNATVANNTVVLNWSSANNSRFEIERSFYSNEFTTVSTMQLPFATTTVNNFRINDNAAELAGRKVAYYRVKQTNANGVVTYSNTMVVNLANALAPVKTYAAIRFNASQNGNAVINIKSVTGQTVGTINSIIVKGHNNIAVENISNKGIFTAVITVNGAVVDTQKFIAE